MTRLIAPLIIVLTFFSCSHQDNTQELIQARLKASLKNSTLLLDRGSRHFIADVHLKKQYKPTWQAAHIWMNEAEWLNVQIERIVLSANQFQRSPEVNGKAFSKYMHDLENTRDSIQIHFSEFTGAAGDYFAFIPDFIFMATGQTSLPDSTGLMKIPDYAFIFLYNQLALLKYRLNEYCWSRTEGNDDSVFPRSLTVTQNKSILRPGETLKLKATLNNMHLVSNAVLYFDQHKAEPITAGDVFYKLNAPEQPGNYTLPVRARYIDMPEGKETENIVWVYYTVIADRKK